MGTSVTSQVSISDLTIEVVRKNIKHIHLAVYPPQGRVRVAAPLWTSDDAVRIFAVARLPWIRRQQSKFEQQARQTPREYVSGETHYVQGRRYRLRFVASEQREVKLSRYLLMSAPAESSVQERETLLHDWYRARLKAQIPELVVKWSTLMDVPTVQWGVKRMKTKWGSCNAEARRIWLNLELAKKPYHCLEYVIVHELAHSPSVTTMTAFGCCSTSICRCGRATARS
jgi:predicted metal-dependent hydrolase